MYKNVDAEVVQNTYHEYNIGKYNHKSMHGTKYSDDQQEACKENVVENQLSECTQLLSRYQKKKKR